MVKAVIMQTTGGPEVLQIEAIDLPKLQPKEVRVRHLAIGLNFIDIYHRTGVYPVSLPTGLGMEAAGIVEDVGTDVANVKTGDRVVFVMGQLGAYAEVSHQPSARLIPLPNEIAFQTAAAITLKGMTAAYLLLKTFPVKAGQTILLHAAAGGTGLLILQWAKSLGARVIGTVGSEEKAKIATDLGCDHVILYRHQNVVAEVKRITSGKCVPVVYDSVGADTYDISLQCLQPKGVFVSFGNSSGPVQVVNPMDLATRGSLFFTRPTLATYAADRKSTMALAQALFTMIGSGAIDIVIGKRYALDDIQKAHFDLESRQIIGSGVITP